MNKPKTNPFQSINVHFQFHPNSLSIQLVNEIEEKEYYIFDNGKKNILFEDIEKVAKTKYSLQQQNKNGIEESNKKEKKVEFLHNIFYDPNEFYFKTYNSDKNSYKMIPESILALFLDNVITKIKSKGCVNKTYECLQNTRDNFQGFLCYI